ncbi:C40 family peptidase [Membranicola marinus]|uniref:C40 family peptidase n=1 Tax=Membranihabitans marinus TaxID=1227546 RepID=A0A953HSX8_9BACT|nr:C40 family peptidase [Membranihabitans marinus]MBY5957815.1 C40 family peptidase [Membranihabitans marinus]
MVNFTKIPGYILMSFFFVSILSCSFQKKTNKMEFDTVNPARYDIVQDARNALGAGYRYGGTGKNKYDCSGLVLTLFAEQDIQLPRSASGMIRYGEKINKDELLPGDLVFFRHGKRIDHVAVVSRMGPAKTWMIHSTTSRGVIEEVLEDSSYWSRRVAQYRRVIP